MRSRADRTAIYRVLCPDWIKWTGMPENVIYLLHEQEEGDLMLEVSIPSIHIR